MDTEVAETTEPIITHQLLRPSEVMERLNVSRSLAYRLLKTGVIPTVRFSSSVRVRPSDLEEFIQRSWSGWKQGKE